MQRAQSRRRREREACAVKQQKGKRKIEASARHQLEGKRSIRAVLVYKGEEESDATDGASGRGKWRHSLLAIPFMGDAYGGYQTGKSSAYLIPTKSTNRHTHEKA